MHSKGSRTTAGKPKLAIDPFDVFVNAWGFHSAATVLDHQRETNVFAWPTVINGVFAVELFFKALLIDRKTDAKINTHDLKVLYSFLSKADQRRIRVELRKVLRNHPLWDKMRKQKVLLDIGSILERSSDIFPTQRYWHEKRPLKRDSRNSASMAGVEPLANALYAVLITLHPEWHQRFKEFTKSDTFVKHTPLGLASFSQQERHSDDGHGRQHDYRNDRDQQELPGEVELEWTNADPSIIDKRVSMHPNYPSRLRLARQNTCIANDAYGMNQTLEHGTFLAAIHYNALWPHNREFLVREQRPS